MADRQPEPCRCGLCLALVALARSAERNYQAAKAARKLRVIEPKERRAA